MLVARRPIFVYIDLSLWFAAITVPFGTGPILAIWEGGSTRAILLRTGKRDRSDIGKWEGSSTRAILLRGAILIKANFSRATGRPIGRFQA
jgi:hypothetical protein